MGSVRYQYGREPDGTRYIVCPECGAESVPADPDRLLHRSDCRLAREAIHG